MRGVTVEHRAVAYQNGFGYEAVLNTPAAWKQAMASVGEPTIYQLPRGFGQNGLTSKPTPARTASPAGRR